MRKLLVCQHVAYEPLGTLHALIKRLGFRIRYVNFEREPEAQPILRDDYGLVILGGPMSVTQLERYPHLAVELALIEQAMAKRIPVLGICLGAQLIAKALGATVQPNPHPEIGWYEVSTTAVGRADAVLQHFQHREHIFQWHCDTFSLPRGAERLASTSTCPQQAFRYGTNVYAFQFHLEVEAAMIRRWYGVPSHIEELRRLGSAIDLEQVESNTARYLPRLQQLSELTFSEFFTRFGRQRSCTELPSR